MREPEALLGRRVEAAILDHANPRVLDGHVLAAAFEAPLGGEDRKSLGTAALERASVLPELRKTSAGFTWTGRDYPAARVSLRSAGIDSVLVVEQDSGAVLGVVERERAYSTVHAGAVYLHLGEPYLVSELDLAAGAALVLPFTGDWYTQAKKDTTTAIEEVLRDEPLLGCGVAFGRVSVTEHVVAFQRRSTRDGTVLETVALDLPPATFDTEAVWFVPGPEVVEEVAQMPALLASLHAAEHALIAVLPLFAMCDRWDIGGLSTNVHFQTKAPTVFVYDGHPGGVGIAERGYAVFQDWVRDTAKLIAGCPCEGGCPSCVQSPKCGNLNDMLDKAGAVNVLRRMLARTTP
jgi:DEAD/DEAH box helicase domain-containing protein